jgi:protein-disulfide isomerase-like protein with CxxC motif
LDQEGKAMFVRCAFFKGTIKAGMEEAFHAHWRDHVLPHWRAFPHVLEVRVMRDVESDDDTSRFPLVMAMKFAERGHIAEALASDVRWASKAASKPLIDMLDGYVIHTVFEMDEFSPAG